MNHSRSILAIAVLLIIMASVGVSALAPTRKAAAPDPSAPAPATWTPTPQPPAAPEVAAATSTPVRIVVSAPTPTPVAPPGVEPPSLLPEFADEDQGSEPTEVDLSSANTSNVRVDAVGPVPLATVAPLALGTGSRPVRLLIPILNLDTPVEPMGWRQVRDKNGLRSEWEVVDYAAGHHINSAYPGEAGNVVLSGHNNIGGSVFRSVCVIGEPGVDFGLEDEMILIDERGRRFTYRVNSWRRMKEANASIARRIDNAQWLQPTDHAQLTLVTCWPPWSNTHRVVVTGLLTAID